MIWIENARDIELTAQKAYELTVAEKKYKDVIKEVFSYVNRGVDCSIREWKSYSFKVNSFEVNKILEQHGMMQFMDRVMDDVMEKYKQLGYFITNKGPSGLSEARVVTISWSKRDLARIENVA